MRFAVLLVLLPMLGCRGTDPPAPDTLRVMAYNIHHGEGMDEVLDLERIAGLIQEVNPDVVTLQEVDSVVTRTDGTDQAAELGRLTELAPVFGRFMPYQGGAYGMAVLSRWEILDTENIRLPDGAEPRTSVSVTLQSPDGDRQIRVVGIHFYRTEEERMAQASVLDSFLSTNPMPTVLAGDFNSTPDSPVMEYLGSDWQIVGKGEDGLTFPSDDPDREIDFVLLRPAEHFEVVRHWQLDEPVISDHRPLVIDLVLRD